MNKATSDNLPVLQKKYQPFTEYARALTITTASDMATAADMRGKLKEAAKIIKDDKEKLTKPLNTALKEIRSRYAAIEDAVDEALESVNKKMTRYQTEQQRIADEKAEKIANRVAPGRGNLSPETAERQMANIDAPARVLDSTGFIPVKQFEVVSLVDLPLEYHLSDDVAIRKAMFAGVELPGVHYFTEQRPRSR